MKFSQALAAAALSSVVALSHAANGMLLNTTAVGAGTYTTGTFLVDASSARSIFTLSYSPTTAGDTFTSFSLYQDLTPVDLLVNPDKRNTNFISFQSSQFYNLDAGSYYFKVGTSGAGNIAISFASDVGVSPVTVSSPVPEPESLALALAGLGVAGTLVRRRKRA